MNAIRTLAQFALEGIEARSVSEKITIYEAIAKCLPQSDLSQMADRIAFSLRETQAQQQKFNALLDEAKS